MVDGSVGGVRHVPTFCSLCVSTCGATATVADGALLRLQPDPTHPTGQALCIKGKAAPELVGDKDRLLYPVKRTSAKGAAAPRWQRISWDDALDEVAARLTELSRDHGPESVVFGSASPSTSAMSDSVDWLMRLRRAFGSPNMLASMELCGWGRFLASTYTYGEAVPGAYLPDLEQAGCILYWGYNPSVARLAHATATTAALRRGARLVVVDPRRAGLASKADHWLRVRPGTDAALALAMTHVMISHGWYDQDFVRRWTNAPLLVRDDDGSLLRANDVFPHGDAMHYVAWDAQSGGPVAHDPSAGGYGMDENRLALTGGYGIRSQVGEIACRPVFELLAQSCAQMSPEAAEAVTGVPATQIMDAAQTLWESRPVAFYTWSGLEQHSNSTQTARAIGVLYALTGCVDTPGGNVLFASVPANRIDGSEFLTADQRAKAIGIEQHGLGPARFEFITGPDFYDAALAGRAHALVNFGANLVMAHADSARGRSALAALDFFVHTDLFMSPTAELADIVLPAATPFEVEALRIGFAISQAAQSLVQLRAPLVAPRGESRSDVQIIFDLAVRLGLGDRFFDGDIDAALRHQLAPSGITLEQLRGAPAGVRVPLTTRHRKYAEAGGFRTPTGKIELYSERLHAAGHPSLPTFTEPGTSPRSRPDLAERFPLVLTCAKTLWFCESQHRSIAGLRKSAADPQVEIHPDTAVARGIAGGEWVRIATPHGSVRARAKLNANLDPSVVSGQHGWWQACPDLDLPGFAPYGPDSANLNLVLRAEPSDPISRSAPLRASMCEIAPL
jgi:anaerobic selenocysteine-containing dehydrogenase